MLIHVVTPFIEEAVHLLIFYPLTCLFIGLHIVEHPPCVGYTSKYFPYASDHSLISSLPFCNAAHPKGPGQRAPPPRKPPFFTFPSLLIFIFSIYSTHAFAQTYRASSSKVHFVLQGGNTVLINTVMVPWPVGSWKRMEATASEKIRYNLVCEIL